MGRLASPPRGVAGGPGRADARAAGIIGALAAERLNPRERHGGLQMCKRKLTAALGGSVSMALLVIALLGWRRGEAIAASWSPHNLAVLTWAVRTAQVSLGAIAEGLLA